MKKQRRESKHTGQQYGIAHAARALQSSLRHAQTKQQGYTYFRSFLPLVPISPKFLFRLEYKQSLSVSRPSHYRQYHTRSQAVSVQLETSTFPIHSRFLTHISSILRGLTPHIGLETFKIHRAQSSLRPVGLNQQQQNPTTIIQQSENKKVSSESLLCTGERRKTKLEIPCFINSYSESTVKRKLLRYTAYTFGSQFASNEENELHGGIPIT